MEYVLIIFFFWLALALARRRSRQLRVINGTREDNCRYWKRHKIFRIIVLAVLLITFTTFLAKSFDNAVGVLGTIISGPIVVVYIIKVIRASIKYKKFHEMNCAEFETFQKNMLQKMKKEDEEDALALKRYRQMNAIKKLISYL